MTVNDLICRFNRIRSVKQLNKMSIKNLNLEGNLMSNLKFLTHKAMKNSITELNMQGNYIQSSSELGYLTDCEQLKQFKFNQIDSEFSRREMVIRDYFQKRFSFGRLQALPDCVEFRDFKANKTLETLSKKKIRLLKKISKHKQKKAITKSSIMGFVMLLIRMKFMELGSAE
uniref:Leucine rich repeats-containing protein n=1 Tax=Trepomonas sp. PC1 TaxID=1076344 RepID=A0A146K197_9EUKA|eukprot:JAP89431.1 Hypothetical protein TPC1_31074 [Trepomonas sp. PC1]